MSTEPITTRGAQKLQDELSDLVNNKRQKVIQAIADAREHGDLKENAEYHAAKEEQGHIESRIQEIQLLLSNAEIIDISKIDNKNKTVVFGASVELSDLDNDKKTKYQIVGHDEADIEKGLLSYKSPVAAALISKEKGNFVTVTTPRGEKNYEIIKISYK
jgi:transcription elongation factor GreA